MGSLCAALRTSELGFRPTDVVIRPSGADSVELPYDEDVWGTIGDTPDVEGLELDTDGSDPSASCGVFPVEAELQVSGVLPSSSFLDAALALPGLIGGASGDGEDGRWQSETNPNHYRMWFDGPWENLARKVDNLGREIIDVSDNPGRITDSPGMRLWAAQDVWFGPGSALVIDHDAVASLPVGRVTDLGGGRWHVRLWEDDASVEEIRKAQQVLRNHLGYDAAESRADEIRDALTSGRPDDPMFVAEDGSFPHGGTQRFLQYFSASKYPTTRSRAAWLNIQEFDDDHHLVHDEYVDLSTQPHPDLG